MRQNVGGTVVLYGIIHADGTVGSVRVLRSVDQRVDQFASEAIAKWSSTRHEKRLTCGRRSDVLDSLPAGEGGVKLLEGSAFSINAHNE